MKENGNDSEMICMFCGYDLYGLDNNRCPECGHDFDPGDPATYVNPKRAWIPSTKLGKTLLAGVCLGSILLWGPLIVGIATSQEGYVYPNQKYMSKSVMLSGYGLLLLVIFAGTFGQMRRRGASSFFRDPTFLIAMSIAALFVFGCGCLPFIQWLGGAI